MEFYPQFGEVYSIGSCNNVVGVGATVELCHLYKLCATFYALAFLIKVTEIFLLAFGAVVIAMVAHDLYPPCC